MYQTYNTDEKLINWLEEMIRIERDEYDSEALCAIKDRLEQLLKGGAK